MEILVYILLGLSSFLFVIIPVSGSSVINPLLSLIIEPHAAISIAAFFFFLNSTIKAFIFRKNILFKYVKGIMPISIIGSILGTLLVGFISEKLLLLVVLLFSVYFLFKSFTNVFFHRTKPQSTNKIVLSSMSLTSGFLQGTGLGSGGGLRKQYLLAQNISLAEMNGTTSFISAWILLISVIVRLATDQVTFGQLIPVLYIVPIIIISTLLGRTVLKRINKKNANIIILAAMIVITTAFGYQFFI